LLLLDWTNITTLLVVVLDQDCYISHSLSRIELFDMLFLFAAFRWLLSSDSAHVRSRRTITEEKRLSKFLASLFRWCWCWGESSWSSDFDSSFTSPVSAFSVGFPLPFLSSGLSASPFWTNLWSSHCYLSLSTSLITIWSVSLLSVCCFILLLPFALLAFWQTVCLWSWSAMNDAKLRI